MNSFPQFQISFFLFLAIILLINYILFTKRYQELESKNERVAQINQVSEEGFLKPKYPIPKDLAKILNED